MPAATGGGISLTLGWYSGPAPHQWSLIERPLIFGNTIMGTPYGIDIGARALVHSAVLFNNRCNVSGRRVDAPAARVVMLCPAPSLASCECPR